MKIVAAVFADFEESFLGASQLRAPLGSRTVIGSTLARLMHVDGLAGRCLFVRTRDENAARAATRAAGLEANIDVVALDDGNRPRRWKIPPSPASSPAPTTADRSNSTG